MSVGLHWNLFNGLSDKARIDASQFALRRTEAEEKRADSAIQLQVRGPMQTFEPRGNASRLLRPRWRKPKKAFASRRIATKAE